MEFLQKFFNREPVAQATLNMAWVNELHGMDDISAIEFSTQKIIDYFKSNAYKNDHHLERLFSIDEKTHSIVERITSHFINIEIINKEIALRISDVAFLYHRQLFLVYRALIENHSEVHHPLLHILLARAFRNATQMIKWRYYNYQTAPANVWLQISQLYKVAEQQMLLNAKIQAYADQEPVSLSTAYIHACMLGSLESISLKCQQIELISKILIAWSTKISIDSTYNPEHHLFYVDTASNTPAKRIRNFKPSNTYRYWSFESVNSKIELCMSLIEYKIEPKQLLLKDIISSKYAPATFEILSTEWSLVDYKRQRRAEERHKSIASINATFGFKDICRELWAYEKSKTLQGGRFHQDNKSFEERLAGHNINRNIANIMYISASTNNSTIVDQSSKGLGLHVIKQAHELSLGMLVGITAKEQKFCSRFGLVRSVRPLANNQLHIGIELLGNLGFLVNLENVSLTARLANNNVLTSKNLLPQTTFGNTGDFIDSGFDHDTHKFCGIHLPQEHSLATQETLLIPKLQYNKNDIFKVTILGEEMLIRFIKSYENHGSWVRVTFTSKINSHQTGAVT